jgi:hypothetical protein
MGLTSAIIEIPAPETHMEGLPCRQPASPLDRMHSHNNWGQIQLSSGNGDLMGIATACQDAGRYAVEREE